MDSARGAVRLVDMSDIFCVLGLHRSCCVRSWWDIARCRLQLRHTVRPVPG
jgi:hypothetical protein